LGKIKKRVIILKITRRFYIWPNKRVIVDLRLKLHAAFHVFQFPVPLGRKASSHQSY